MNFARDHFEVLVHRRIEDAGKLWDDFDCLPGTLKSPYLKALEESDPSDMEFRYVMIFRNRKLAGCAYLQVVNFSGKNFSGHASWPLLFALKLFFHFKKVKLIFCGNLLRSDCPCVGFDTDAIGWDGLFGILKKIVVRENGDLLMLKEVNTSHTHPDLLTKHGFNRYDEDKSMVMQLPLEWSGFDDYLSSLTKKYRKRVRQIRGKKGGVSVREIGEDEMLTLLPRIGDLFNQTASRQFLKMGLINENYFVALKNALGSSTVFTGYFHEEKLVAFSTHLHHPDTLEVHYIGIDYSYNQKYGLYFNILYDGLEQAIRLRKDSLDLGRTAREAKASLGCEPAPSKDYLFVKKRLIAFFIRIFERLFLNKMGNRWKSRNPLKKKTEKKAALVFPT